VVILDSLGPSRYVYNATCYAEIELGFIQGSSAVKVVIRGIGYVTKCRLGRWIPICTDVMFGSTSSQVSFYKNFYSGSVIVFSLLKYSSQLSPANKISINTALSVA
jgi:hypothetical protein